PTGARRGRGLPKPRNSSPRGRTGATWPGRSALFALPIRSSAAISGAERLFDETQRFGRGIRDLGEQELVAFHGALADQGTRDEAAQPAPEALAHEHDRKVP